MIYLILGFIIGVVMAFIYRENKRQKRKSEMNEWETKDRARVQADVQRYLTMAKKNPRKCDICSDKKGKRVNFEGLSWYHCKKCGSHGFPSIYEESCTDCSNAKL